MRPARLAAVVLIASSSPGCGSGKPAQRDPGLVVVSIDAGAVTPGGAEVDLAVGDPTWVGTMWGDGIERVLREAITPLSPCAAGLAEGTELEVRFEVGDDGAVTGATATGPDSFVDCAQAAALGVRFEAPLAPFPPVSIGGRWTVIALVGTAIAPERRCVADDDCLLVTGGCEAPSAAHRLHARVVDAANDEILGRKDCMGGGLEVPMAVRVECRRGSCSLTLLDHIEWNGCSQDAECTAVLLGDGAWRAIARDHVDDPVAAGAREIQRGDDPPEAQCHYRACVAPWVVH